MSLDGVEFGLGDSSLIARMESQQFSLTVPVPPAGQSDSRNAMIRLCGTEREGVERALVTHARVHRDFAIQSKRVELATGPDSKISQGKVKFEWTHAVSRSSSLPKAVISKALEGRVDVTVESTRPSELIGTRLQRDHLQLLVDVCKDSQWTELDEPLGIALTLPESSVTEYVSVRIVDGRSLLTPKKISFGLVRSGVVSRRAFVIRAVDSEPIGSINTSISGSGVMQCQVQKDLGAGRMLVTAAFHSILIGEFKGQVTLAPAGGQHLASSISYEATVVP